MPAARLGPKALLSLCHQVDDLAEKIREFGRFPVGHLDEMRRRAIRRIRKVLRTPGAGRFRAALRSLQRRHALRDTEVVILLFLFDRRIRRASHQLSGRDLLGAITRYGGDVIEAARYLHPKAPLLSSGLVAGTASRPEDALDGEVRIGDAAFSTLYREFHSLPKDDGDRAPDGGYANAAEHLLDLRTLCDLARRRAGKLFPMSQWAESASNDDRDAAQLTGAILRAREAIDARERATAESVRLPVVMLRAEHGLSDDEEIVLLSLLEHELFASQTTLELVELVRLVAPSEEELLARRALVAPEGRLRQAGLVCVEEEPAGKDAFASAWLPAGLTERLLGNLDPKGKIGVDEKRSFRQYLERLRGSDDFYRRL
jgi:hypothetical protein